MDFFYAILLGLLQGATEFLPISSSGHLVLAEHLLPGWHAPGVLFDALLHAGTLGSIVVYYRRELAELGRATFRREKEAMGFVAMLVIGSVPTALIGLGFKDQFEAWFSSPAAVGGFLLVTAGLLLVARASWPRADRPRAVASRGPRGRARTPDG